ncbi:MAG: hypothetical protein SFY80_16700 [Verrucomicrobiota bacterium]|nr:hypothetical protein [Verrucomicrobiota bacterium]
MIAKFLLILLTACQVYGEAVQLPIEPRLQWDNNSGYCGETSIQQAALHFGGYVSQHRIREIIDPSQQQDVWVPDHTVDVLTALRLTFTNWDSEKPTPQYQVFLNWMKTSLLAGHPVVFGVFVKDLSSQEYDHIVLATGFSALSVSVFHEEDRLFFHDNYSPDRVNRTFGSLWDTRSMNGNGSAHEYCIPRDTNYACAITGVADDSGDIRPVRLMLNRWDEPNVVLGETPVTLNAIGIISGLTPGKAYALLRYDDYNLVPRSAYLSSPYSSAVHFVADGEQKTFTDQIPSNGVAIYRCVPLPALVLPQLTTTFQAGALQLRFPTATGQTYLVETCVDLGIATWTAFGTEFPGSGQEVTMTDTNFMNKRISFYRVRVKHTMASNP